MYHLPSNWTAQRSAEQESEMGYLARIWKGEARDAMDSTITTIGKTQGPRLHSDPLEACQAGGEKAPCVRAIGICPPASVREDSHDIPPCTLEPPLLLSEEILMLRFILLGPWPRNLELDTRRRWPQGSHSSAEPESLQVSGM